MNLRKSALAVMSSLVLSFTGCSSSSSTGGTGGGSTGPAGTGGRAGTGGATGTGGAPGSGGTLGTGGATGTGGAPGSGGATSTGGGGGNTGGGGGIASGVGGGAGRGNGGRGGAAGRAGSPGTGTAGTTGAGGTAPTMNFFVTSRGPGMGGNLNGLAGADAFCKTLATAVSAALGAKTWHAYLSTSTTNARDRIGTGPWYNAAGRVIANNLADLHDQVPANAALNATWPIADTTVALDEHGAEVPLAPLLVHDILTGSNTDGTVMTGATCNDWTSQLTTDIAEVGHSNRSGGGRPPSWNNAHATSGCAQFTAGMDMQVGTVSSGGGRGSIYCFAVP